jgi:hypothetical protein
MSSKLAKAPTHETTWGEDVFALVSARALGSDELARQTEESVEKRYRLELRDRFVHDVKVSRAIEESRDCLLNEASWESIRGLLVDSIRAGTEEIFDRILKELLVELDAMYKGEPTAYLVDRENGKIIMPITDREIYTPPPYTDEAGITHPSKPMLHPAVAAPLMLKKQEDERQSLAVRKATEAGQLPAVEHLVLGPDAILERARTLLQGQNVEVAPLQGSSVQQTVEVGRERLDDMLQAPNYSFHRSQMYGSLLAKKVLDLLSGQRKCELRSAVLRRGSKEQWYEVSVEIPHVP